MVHSRRYAFPVSRVQAKKTRQGPDALSHFHVREKTVHTVITLFTFLERKKKNGPLDHFFNLRLRMVAMPLREHV